MKKLTILSLLLAMPFFAQAQNPQTETKAEVGAVEATVAVAEDREITPRFEAFAGFSYLRLDADIRNDRNLNGFNSSFTYNFNRFVGATGEVGGFYGNRSTSGAKMDQFFFLAGPKFAFRGNSRVTPFAHFLPGVVRQNIKFGANDASSTQFALATGGGLDIKLTDRIALRGAQADYLMTRLGNSTQNNIRISTGFVVNFW
jgi:opacity protein-like surface antigen